MMDKAVLGIDAGAGSLRAALFDLRGNLFGVHDQEYRTLYPRPGWTEQRPDDGWTARVAVGRGCLGASGIASCVVGLAVAVPCAILTAPASRTRARASSMTRVTRATPLPLRPLTPWPPLSALSAQCVTGGA